MSRRALIAVLALGLATFAYLAGRYAGPGAGAPALPQVAASVDYIRHIGDLAVLRASVKEVVTTPVAKPGLFTTRGKLAVICHFDIKYKYDLSKARIAAGSRADGSRYCMIHLPRHQYEITTREVRFYDDKDGTWQAFAQRTPPDERATVLDAARAKAESQAKTFLTQMEGEIQASARSTLDQIARAFGFTDVTVEFEK